MGSLRSLAKTFAFSLALFLSAANLAQAGTVFLSPASGNYSVGQTFSVKVIASSPAQAINAVSGNIEYSADKLQIVGLSKADTIMNLWVEEPAFSNKAGTLNFSGVVLNPGYIGSRGTVLSIIFKAAAPGTAKVDFSSGDLLANDGNGTSVLESLGNAEFKLTAPVQIPQAPIATTTEVAPIVSTTPTPTPTPVVAVKCPPTAPEKENLLFGLPLSIVISLSASLLALLFLIVLALLHRHGLSPEEGSGCRKVKASVESAFEGLKGNLRDYAKIVQDVSENHQLTKNEGALIDRLKRNLNDAEKHILSEIEHLGGKSQ